MKQKKITPMNFLLFVYFFLSIVYLETLLRVFTEGSLLGQGMLFSTIFALVYASGLFILTTFFRPKVNLIIALLFSFVLSLLFSAQFIYYEIFKTFYTVYSALHATRAVEFAGEAMHTMKSILPQIFSMWIPFLLLLFAPKRMKRKMQVLKVYVLIFIVFAVSMQFLASGLLNLYDDGRLSAQNLYEYVNHPQESVRKLGMLTYLRLDGKRMIFGNPAPPLEDAPAQNGDQEEPEEPEEPVEDPMEFQVMDIDFDSLIAEESDEDLIQMHQYFKNRTPTDKNEHTGLFEGYNLIFITAEAFSHLAIDKELTPNLYKLYNEGYQFTNFYTHYWGVSTSDGEYVATTGIMPKSGVWSYSESADNYMPFSMGNQLKEEGYETKAYHNNSYRYYDRHLSHPNMGYDYKGVGNGLDVKTTWPASDLEMMEVTMPEYIEEESFHAYYMTVSGHLNYNFMGNQMAYKNRDLVSHLPYSEAVQAYLATQIEFDRSIGYLLEQLEESGKADNTLIAISSDHYPYGLTREENEELAGKPLENEFELNRNAFLLYAKGMESEKIEKPASSLDIIPTLSNLLGLDCDSRLLMGRDIFSTHTEPIAVFADRSFESSYGRYFSEENRFEPNEKGKQLTESEIEEHINEVSADIEQRFYYSARILETDYYRKIFQKK